ERRGAGELRQNGKRRPPGSAAVVNVRTEEGSLVFLMAKIRKLAMVPEFKAGKPAGGKTVGQPRGHFKRQFLLPFIAFNFPLWLGRKVGCPYQLILQEV